MAETITRPETPYSTKSKLLAEHMAEHGMAVEFTGDPNAPIESDLGYTKRVA